MTWYVYASPTGEEYRTQIMLTSKQMDRRGLKFVRKVAAVVSENRITSEDISEAIKEADENESWG